jgi:hypothetical protein
MSTGERDFLTEHLKNMLSEEREYRFVAGSLLRDYGIVLGP